jgi:phosphohistidine phosphatase SixA
MERRKAVLRSAERRRRRRRRIIAGFAYIVITFAVAWYFELQATTTVMFVRHADVDDPLRLDGDPPLNAAGHARAELLARFLERIDVTESVDAIYTTSMTRTQQTAAPLAARLGIEPEAADPSEPQTFADELLRAHKGEIVLVVTDRETIAPLIEELHGSKNVPEIAPDEYDNLYIVTVPWGEGSKVKTLRLSYGLMPEPATAPRPRDDTSSDG